MLKKLAIDITPLRKYPDFRRLWSSGLISYFGSMITYVALPFQIKELTNSYIAVGLMGAVELIPLIIFGLYGGVLADRVDRRKMILITEFALMIMTFSLFINSQLAEPSLIWIYVVAGSFAALDGLQRPSADAILPRLVGHEDLPSASALMSLRWQTGVITGPALAGILLATAGTGTAYLVDVITFAISIIFILRVKSVKPLAKNPAPTFGAMVEGIKYATSRKDLLGTYLVDLAAMFFAMPNALFPFWADQLDATWALGLFYAAGTIGSVIVTLTSGWIKNYHHHGRAVFLAALGWGAAITLAGTTDSLFLILLFLAIAGASDMVSALFRGAIWNQSIPDELRGRLAGIELLSYSVGPLGGQMRAGTFAAVTNLRTSVISGGLLCIGFVTIAAAALPKFRKYDARTNEFAVEQRKIRAEDAKRLQIEDSDQ
ncbi:MAG: MFS transporter [Actinobacteria bacterium]|nr:MFS transporter [Actinomycetota bacterium]MSW22162.1 MFS transporter [Actinomycetota bacterium]MSX04132.1 MFS transporter [Actinomycetota bacterium]MSX84789.1 MFS transporter [Actinomycetota bacterium]MUH55216.1 MFS transporter [Actinomycetota bacterium]